MQEKEIHLRDYLRIVSKRKYTVITFFFLVFIIVLIGTFSAQTIYMSTTELLIEKGEPRNQLSLNYYYPQMYDPDFYSTQYQLIKSVSVSQNVVENLAIDKTFESYFDLSMDRSSNNAAKAISSGIIVNPVKESRIVRVSYMSPNPELATLIVNSVARAYIEKLLEMRLSSSRYTIEWMTEKAEAEKTKLERAESTLQQYMRDNDIITVENKIAVLPQKLSELSTRLVTAEAKRKEAESLHEKIKKTSDRPGYSETISIIVSNPVIQSLREQVFESEQKIKDLSKKYREKHPLMIRARSDHDVLKQKKEQEIIRVIESLKNEYELTLSSEKSLRKLLADTKQETLNLNEKYMQYEVLKRDLETNKQLYDTIMKRIKEHDITKQIQTVNVWVVEKAQVPQSPVKPRKTLNILLGIIFGLFGGIGLAFFIDYLDNTIKNPEEVETKLGIPVLGIISLFKEKGNIENIVRDNPGSAFAEGYKTLRTSILLSSANKPPRNILITSIGPEEGKTVTSSNLALSIAQSEHSVLLIDGDLRKPRIHKVFGLDNSRGLSSFLAGLSDDTVISQGPAENLMILPSGPVPPNPSELLGSGRMNDLLEIINKRFEIILWDSAPLLTVADSLILSKILDGTIVVSWAGKTTYEGMQRALKAMKDLDSHILGVIINAFDIKKNDYYYYKYYKYYSQDET